MVDSGVGGLTVARAVLDQLPHEALHYVGDTANSPYGPKPIAEVRAHALALMDELVDSGVKALVIACNSASAACLRDARERYEVPVVEVILPAVRRAVAATRNGRVGVIGTVATITSGAYEDAFAAAPGVDVITAACPRFAEFVERGVTSGRQLLGLAESYLAPLNAAGVDTLVLGCTHYPLLTGLLSVVMGDSVTTGVQRRGDGEGRVPRAARARICCAPTTRRRRSTCSGATGPAEPFARLQPALPRPGASRPSYRHASRRCRVKLTVLGCSGSVPGPDSPASGYLVEAEGYRLRARPRPRRVRRAAALRRAGRRRRDRHLAPARRPLHRPHRVRRRAALRRRGHRCAGRTGASRSSAPPARGTGIEAAYDPLARKLGLHELFAFSTRRSGELGPFAHVRTRR